MPGLPSSSSSALEPAPVADFHAEWTAALEQLEVDVDLAEAMLAADHEPRELTPWEPPAVRGPLPTDLEPRARLVLERQLAVAHRLSERLTSTGRERRFTQRLRDNAAVDIPVYVDLRA